MNDKLESFGIIPLTGEACAYSIRILCDYTADGQAHLERFLGTTLIPQEPWNSSTDGKRHVGCIMISRNTFQDLHTFCLLQRYPYVLKNKYGECSGVTEEHYKLYCESDLELVKDCTWYHSPGFDRNQHQMSGRTY